ncbi:MAG: GNAT family N-acetyltransferase [Chloroflexi bacterium]|nr:GNAT family N-acetyltransferase [Chloroflexota bacterium]
MKIEKHAVVIRTAQEGDIAALTELCGQLGYPASEDSVAWRVHDLVRDPAHRIFVAHNPGAGVVGWIHVFVRRLLVADPHIEIGGLIVDEAQRGLGIGEELIKAVEAWAQSLGIPTIFVRTNIIREGAHRFYERLGFQLIKTSRTYQKYNDLCAVIFVSSN